MRLARLDVSRDAFAAAAMPPALVETPLILRITDADTVITLAGAGRRWPQVRGVWLRASAGYSAALIARDVKTLSTLRPIEHVVIDAESNAAAHAEVVDALLSDREVTLDNAVAHLSRAYNRPAPPQPICVWSVQGEGLVHGSHSLHRQSAGEVTIYDGD